MGSGPKSEETDYKQVYRNFSGYHNDATARYEKQSGIARAKMAQSGIQEGSNAWKVRMGEVEKNYGKERREIDKGFTGQQLREGLTKSLKWRGVNIKQAREYQKLGDDEYKSALKEKESFTVDREMWDSAYQEQKKATDIRSLKASRTPDYLDALEKFQTSGGKDYRDLADLQYGKRYGQGKGELAMQEKKDAAMNRAKEAASGGSSKGNASAAMLAEDESKKQTANPWI